MATVKSFTSLEQSKKLAEILPIESADMFYSPRPSNEIPYVGNTNTALLQVPRWSLAALLDVLPTKLRIVLVINDFQGDRKEKYVIGSVEHDRYDCYADNPVDACVAMIEKLHELKML